MDGRPGHPLLRGGRPGDSSCSSSGFSSSQMNSLSAICDTFIPSLSLPEAPDPQIRNFFLASATQHAIPRKVAELLATRTKTSVLLLSKSVLWLLSTRIGTLILCGRASLKPEFPYLQAFDEVTLPARERILKGWALGESSLILRILFKVFKICCVFTFYAQADANGQNPAWNAIGYAPPDFATSQTPQTRPLDGGIIELGLETDLERRLRGTGLAVKTETENQLFRVECDAVILGSGCGGAVAAAVLAKEGFKVLVIEKGKYFARNDLTLLEFPSFENMYESGGILSTNDGRILLMAGSTVGGGTAINWSACIRTPDRVLKDWSQNYSLPLFQSHQYQDAMNAVCRRLAVQEHCDRHSFQNEILRHGCANLGIPTEPVPRNSSRGHYCGSCCFGCRTGDKQGTDETWLKDAVSSGAIILSACKAKKLLFEGTRYSKTKKKKAAGVLATYHKTKSLVIKAKVTVVACGALMTPPLLRASGLRNPNIGKHLRLHPVAMAWGYFPEGRGPQGKVFEGGIITTICKEEPSKAILETPALMPGSFSALMPWLSGADMKQRMLRYSRTAHVFALARDCTSSGSVRGEKNIDYRLSKTDAENLREGLARALRVLVAAGATEIGTHHNDGRRMVVEGATQDEIEEFISWAVTGRGVLANMSSAHQMGSCRMSCDEKSGVVDWRGELWEAEEVFVCDSSVFPSAVGVNPMVTVQSLALCISRHVLDSLRRAYVA